MLIILARTIARNRRRRHDYAPPHMVDDVTIDGLVAETASADEIIAVAEGGLHGHIERGATRNRTTSHNRRRAG
jgi:hypothetical protein